MSVINPTFLNYRKFTPDTFWKNIFTLCSQNKFPPGIKFDGKNTLFIKSPTQKRIERIIIPQNEENAYDMLISIFKGTFNIYSINDIKIKREEIKDLKKDIRINLNCEWKKLKPRYVKDRIILNYVIEKKNKMNLNQKQTMQLLSTIQLAIQLKQINSNDIKYENGKIASINGLIFEEDNWIVTNTPLNATKSSKTTSSSQIHHCMDKFIKIIRIKNQNFTAKRSIQSKAEE